MPDLDPYKLAEQDVQVQRTMPSPSDAATPMSKDRWDSLR